MRTATMYWLNRFGNVVAVRENVTEAERMRLLDDPRWITGYWVEWEAV